MCGGEISAPRSLESCWALSGGVLVASTGATRVGASAEIARRIPFGPNSLTLGPLALRNHWIFDIGAGFQTLGWTEWRPRMLAGSVRAMIGYNIQNIMDIGLNFRGGWGHATNGLEERSGLLWAAGLRTVATVPFGARADGPAVSFSLEGGVLSVPGLTGESGLGPYFLLSSAYQF